MGVRWLRGKEAGSGSAPAAKLRVAESSPRATIGIVGKASAQRVASAGPPACAITALVIAARAGASGRSSGLRCIICATSASTDSGTAGLRSLGSGGVWKTCCWRTDSALSPVNGGLPVRSAKSRQPRE